MYIYVYIYIYICIYVAYTMYSDCFTYVDSSAYVFL